MRLALPTASGWLLFLFTLISIAAGLVNPGLAEALTASVLLSLLLSSWIMAQLSLFRYDITRGRSQEGSCMEQLSLPLIVTNLASWTRGGCVITEKCPFVSGGKVVTAVPSVKSRGHITVERRVTAIRRGVFPLRKIYLSVGDPFGLFRKTKVFRIPSEVTITPYADPSVTVPLNSQPSASAAIEGRPLGAAGSGYDFFGVRPFRPGDEVRHVHWRATARARTLMVRETEAAAVDKITLLLDTDAKSAGCDPAENNFEKLISLAHSLVSSLRNNYCRLTFITWFNGGIIRLHGDAAGICGRLTDILTNLEPSSMTAGELLDTSLDDLEPGSAVYMLSMSHDRKLLEKLELLWEERCTVRFVLAPKENFPVLIPGRQRAVRTESILNEPGMTTEIRILNFSSRLGEAVK